MADVKSAVQRAQVESRLSPVCKSVVSSRDKIDTRVPLREWKDEFCKAVEGYQRARQ